MSDSPKDLIAAKAAKIVLGTGDGAVELLRVKAGTFSLGSPATEVGRTAGEGPVRQITLSAAYYLGKVPVTQRQYKALTGKNPTESEDLDAAVDQLTYLDAVAYCMQLSKVSGVTVVLPTEAQWEYACRAGTVSRYWSGNAEEDLAKVGWYGENSEKKPRPVGKKPANPWGFHDMHGNVCEICRDVIADYETVAAVDPVGKVDGKRGMMRGGGYMHPADSCRSASRVVTNDKFGGAGVRVLVAG